MNCLECQEVFQRRLDGEPVGDSPALAAHLAACPECRDRHAAANRLEEGLRGLPRLAPAADLADRTVDRVLLDRGRRLRLRRRVGFLLAASLLLTAAAGYLWLQSAGAPQTPVVLIVVKVQEAPPEPTVSLRQTLGEARAALASLAGRIAGKAKEQTALFQKSGMPLEFVSTEALPRVSLLTQPLESTTQGLRLGGEGAATGMRTVGASGRRAFSYFLRKMPPLQPRQ